MARSCLVVHQLSVTCAGTVCNKGLGQCAGHHSVIWAPKQVEVEMVARPQHRELQRSCCSRTPGASPTRPDAHTEDAAHDLPCAARGILGCKRAGISERRECTNDQRSSESASQQQRWLWKWNLQDWLQCHAQDRRCCKATICQCHGAGLCRSEKSSHSNWYLRKLN